MAVTSRPVRRVLTTRGRWAVIVSVALAFSALSVPLARADDPDLTTSTVFRVSVGADRTGAGQGDVSGLDGVTLGAFSGATQVATCTSVAGVCTLVIPDTGAGGAYHNQRLTVRQISVPTGWYANPRLRTGGSGATPATARDYQFQTPQLTPGEFQSNVLLTSDGMSSSATSGEPASLGTWQQSRDNPELPHTCGIGRVVILTDWSTSVSTSPGYPTLIHTLDQIADAFAGTSAFLSFVPFGYQQLPGSTAYHPMSSPGDVAAFKSLYSSWTAGSVGTQGTNWDAGLRGAAAVKPDLVIMLTDGNPTVWGSGPQGQSSASSNQLADIEAAIFAANTLKASGTRVVALGVGAGVAGVGAELNLSAISGPTKFGGSNYLTADYFQTTDYAQAAEAFREMAMASCAGTLTVVKQIVPPNGTIADAVAAGPGWQFSVSGDTITGASATTATDQTGAVVFTLDADDFVSHTVRISEQQLPGYTLLPVDGQDGGPRAVCTAVGSNTSRTVNNDPDDLGGVILQGVYTHEATTCTFYNRAPEESTSVQVDKRWVINGEAVANGDQPSGLEASLELVALPRASGQYPIDDPQFGEVYDRYADGGSGYFRAADDVTIGETVTDGAFCSAHPELTTIHALEQELDATYDLSKDPLLRAGHKVNLSADPGWNHFVVTNYADCDSPPRWTLSKTSDPASGLVVEKGGRVTYTVTATNLDPGGSFPLRDLTIVDDLSGVLSQADIDLGSIVASTGSATFTSPELVWEVDALDDTATLTYQVVVRDDADDDATITNAVYGQPSGGDPEIPGTEGIPPEQCLQDDPCSTIHHTPPVVATLIDDHDLALRMWVGEAYRGQQLVHQLFPGVTDLGPDYDESYVGFDQPGYYVLPGDLMVHDIQLFNQGTGTARVEQLVGYLPAEGLSLADPAALAAIVPLGGPVTNDYWSLASDGNLYYDPPDPIVILPGETARVSLALVVGAVTAPDPTSSYTTVDMYAEISQFSGLVDATRAAEAGMTIDPADLIPGLNAAWLAVEDVDSHPDNINDEPTDGHYKNHVIDESAFAVVSGLRTFLLDVDEDDHDGSRLRVAQEVLAGEDPVDGSSAGSLPEQVYDLLASTGGAAWPVGLIALVFMTVGWATFAWSWRARSVGRRP